MIVMQADAELRRRGVQNAQPLGNHFRADAVAGKDGDPVFCHIFCRLPFSAQAASLPPARL